MSGSSRIVCVTGASGYIASWLVKFLLRRGYTVRATVRDPNDVEKIQHLRELDGAKERLHFFKASLLQEGCFYPAIEGCDGVFHTASPVFVATKPEDLIEPATNGTLNVLRSCAKAGVKRVILTSSLAAVTYNGRALTPDVVVDETWFSDAAFCTSNQRWYWLSKTLAEEAAWQYAQNNGLDIVAINPGFVIGPLLQRTINATSELFLNTIRGKRTILTPYTAYVDVRDVANAHIQAFEVSSAHGRYCLVGDVAKFSEIANILVHHYPSLRRFKFEDEKEVGCKYQVSKLKTRTLGVNFTPLDVSVKDTVGSLKEKGVLDV